MSDAPPPAPPRRRRRSRFRRYGLPLLILAALAGAWWAAFLELSSRRRPDVPFVTTPPEVVAKMVELADVRDGDVVYDLGCGDGRLVIAACRGRPGARGVGLEIDPDLAEKARTEAAAAGLADRVTVRRDDIFREDFRPATVVMLFLTPAVNERLVPQFETLRPGARVVSHQFRIKGLKPRTAVEVRSAEDGLDHPVYLWVAPFERE